MKKLYALILISVFAGKTYGQDAPPPPPPVFVQSYPLLHPGIIFTPLVSWYSVINDPSAKNNSRATNNGAAVGFDIGATFNKMFTPNYGLEVDPEYEISGGDIVHSFKNGTDNDVVEYKLHLQYLLLPVAFKFETNSVGYIKYFLRIGGAPKLSVGNRANIDTTINSGSHNEVSNVLVRDKITPVNLNLFVGGGLEYNLSGNTSLLLGINYEAGIVNVWRDGDDDLNIKNHMISLNLAILF